jgi:chemotaxis family two-component system response regulator Rcp1
LSEADSYLHEEMRATRRRHHLCQLPAFHIADIAEDDSDGTPKVEFGDAGCLDSALHFVCLSSRSEGGSRTMKQLPQVLLVDDNPADVVLAREALAGGRHKSCIHDVPDGEEAMAFLHRTGRYADALRPDLVILDLNLPKKGGRAVLAEAKFDAELRTIPIVVFSTSTSMLDIARSYQLGANCYVSKPGDLDGYFVALRMIEEFWFGSASLAHEEN